MAFKNHSYHFFAHGLTLIELLTVIGLMSIIFLLGTTSSLKTWSQFQLKWNQYSLYHHLKNARYNALANHHDIYLCPSDQPYHCTNHWPAQGYSIFSEDNMPIHTQILPKSIEINFHVFGNADRLLFSPKKPMTQNGTFSFCTRHNPKECVSIVINKAGRVKRA